MGFTELKKVVIVTETVIKDKILDHIISMGAKGYTIDNVCGRGERGIRDDDTIFGDFLRNIKVEVLTTEEIAEKIAISVVEKFFKNYAGIVYMHDVSVIRPEKFKS
jgi:nitrogen regulatory protein PII